MSKNSIDPDFKATFEAAKASGNTVMEGGAMEDYFQLSSLELHTHLANWAEFTLRCVKAEDLVGLEEVTQGMSNLSVMVTQSMNNLKTIRAAMSTQLAAKKALEDATKKLQRECKGMRELFLNELGMEIEHE